MTNPWENVREYLCMRYTQFIILFVFAILGTLVNAATILAVEPGTMTYVVIQLNFVGLLLLILFSGGVLLMCRRRL